MKYSILILAIIFSLFACERNDEKFSTLSISLTDAPGPYDSVLVEVLAVEIHTEVNGWESLLTNQGIYDLLLLQNDVEAILVQTQTIPAGRVNQMRLVLGQNNRVVVDSLSHPLALSSQDESGLKLNIQRVLQPNTAYLLVMDFDAMESIHVTGNDTYKLKPVVRAEFR